MRGRRLNVQASDGLDTAAVHGSQFTVHGFTGLRRRPGLTTAAKAPVVRHSFSEGGSPGPTPSVQAVTLTL